MTQHAQQTAYPNTSSTDPDPQTLLTRLSQKPGVQSTLILDRTTGAIVRASGLLVSSNTGNSALPTSTSHGNLDSVATGGAAPPNTGPVKGSAEEYAAMVWAFVQGAGGLVRGLDAEDDVKLLRLRTKKCEIVIVPDSRFLLVVVHDTPPA